MVKNGKVNSNVLKLVTGLREVSASVTLALQVLQVEAAALLALGVQDTVPRANNKLKWGGGQHCRDGSLVRDAFKGTVSRSDASLLSARFPGTGILHSRDALPASSESQTMERCNVHGSWFSRRRLSLRQYVRPDYHYRQSADVAGGDVPPRHFKQSRVVQAKNFGLQLAQRTSLVLTIAFVRVF